MDQIIQVFGIDWKLLLAQAVNFAILLYLLRRFLYIPLLKMMDEREQKLKTGIEDAKHAAEERTRTTHEYEEKMAEAKKASARIMEETLKSGEKMKDSIIREAGERAKEIAAAALKDAEKEKGRVVSEAKKELGALVAEQVEKILKNDLPGDKERAYTTNVLN